MRDLTRRDRRPALVYLCNPNNPTGTLTASAGDLPTSIARMRDHGARVGRPFPPLLDYNRLSLGLPSEMERFADLLRDFRRRGWV